MTMTYRLPLLTIDEQAGAALERQRAQVRETAAALRAERLQAAREREERWLSQPGPLARLRAGNSGDAPWRPAEPSLNSHS